MALLKIGAGDFADVFDLGDGSVLKAFRRLRQTGEDVGNRDDEDALTREIFEAEVRAYERLREVPDLARFAPKFYGRLDPGELITVAESESPDFVRGCGLRLEKIPGQAKKFGFLDQAGKAAAYPVLQRIEAVINPGNVWDASCFLPGSRAEITVIDFSAWDQVEECAEILARQGCFTAAQREQLRLSHRIDFDWSA